VIDFSFRANESAKVLASASSVSEVATVFACIQKTSMPDSGGVIWGVHKERDNVDQVTLESLKARLQESSKQAFILFLERDWNHYAGCSILVA